MIELRKGVCVAVAAGVTSPILINNISRFLGIWGGSGVYLVALFVFLLLGWFLGYYTSQSAKLAAFIAFCSIALGVFVDAMLDGFLRAYDRNLWPFEILMWWVLAPVPMVLGVVFEKVFASPKALNN